MPAAVAKETEIKFHLSDPAAMARRLRRLGFRRVSPRMHERNVLYDLPGGVLERRGELLRLRSYGEQWTLTHKSRGRAGRHKSRVELETGVGEGRSMAAILEALGFAPRFRYEKFRSAWSDGHGQVVLDETPIGAFGEIEGPPRWIDRVARELGIAPREYIVATYAELFQEWKRRRKSSAKDMLFKAGGRR
jgi:adenylate cyclase class 2